jgi:hypothetical protein
MAEPEGATMPYFCTFWDWKDDPPFDEIEARLNALITRGATSVHLAAPSCGRDDHCLVISDTPLTEAQAEARWDEWFGRVILDGPSYFWSASADPEPDP